MNFNSQIATTREQSEQLLALGLRIDTADMYWCEDSLLVTDCSQQKAFVDYPPKDKTDEFYPAWSSIRLIEMMPKFICECPQRPYCFALLSDENYWFIDYSDDEGTLYAESDENVFNAIVRIIAWLIKNNHYSSEYLKGETK